MESNLFTRPDKPLEMCVTKRNFLDKLAPLSNEKPLMLDKSTQCFVTPRPIAERMVDYLNAEPTVSVLEPSAGTGNLIQALLDAGQEPLNITAIERDYQLFSLLKKRFYIKFEKRCALNNPVFEVYHNCFLSFAEKTSDTFKYILMNPPFSRRDAKNHIDAALSLLEVGGRLIALVPVTFEHENAYEIEILPAGTFESTQVTTKIIEIEK